MELPEHVAFVPQDYRNTLIFKGSIGVIPNFASVDCG